MPVPAKLPYGINDADNHFLEPEDMYERYIDPRWRAKAVRFVRDGSGQRVQLFGDRPSKLGFTRETAAQSEEEVERLAQAAAPAAADAGAPKPGDGGARSPGMFLNRLNPYKGRSEEERRALIEHFQEQQVAWGDRVLRLHLMHEQRIPAAPLRPGRVVTLEVELC